MRRVLSCTWIVGTLVALGCGELLGIEEARVDPTLAPSGVTSGASNVGPGDGGRAGEGSPPPGGTPSSGGGDSSGGSMSEAGATGEGGSMSPPEDTLCQQYCSTIGEYCRGEQLQYRDDEQCLRICSMLPPGTVGEEDSNTTACRLKYASKARYAGGVELAAYCRQAGPGGDDRCGSNCEGYCSVMMATCTAELGAAHYKRTEECLAACEELPQVPFVYGSESSADGNSVQCRLFHVVSAAMMDPEEHCDHAYGLTLCEDTGE